MRCPKPICAVALFALVVAPTGTPGAETVRLLMRDFIGIDGHTVQFKPELYAPVCRGVRDYHPVVWDLGTNTAEAAPFPVAKNGVDWRKVYGSWRARDFTIDASLMFESVKTSAWHNLETDARVYGRGFAKEFGPSSTGRLVQSVEIGNEPGDWSDADYSRLFRAMAEGIREGDPKLKIATCNLTTGRSGKYEKNVECVAKFPELYDVLNIHSYAQLENWPTWRRSFPEDPMLPKYLQDIEALIRWRDANAPAKAIWLTEFGYDSSTKPAEKTGDFAKWIGVTDEQQAQWLVRSLLVFSAMPIERSYIYFFNDEDQPRLHASAGITRHFQPKPSFHALAHLQRTLGEYRFTRIVTNQPGTMRVHEYAHGSDPKQRIWAAWRPVGDNETVAHTLAGINGRVMRITRMPLTANALETIPVQQEADRVTFLLNGSPLYLHIETL